MAKGCWDALPDDVLQLIINRIQDAKELGKLSLVSPTWRRMCNRVPDLVIDEPGPSKGSSMMFKRALSNRQGLQSLTVLNGHQFLNEGLRFKGHEGLLFEAFSQFSSTLQQIVWTSPICKAVQVPQGLWFPHLHTLKVQSIEFIEYKAAQALVDACPSLRVCELNGVYITEDPWGRCQHLLHFKASPHLEEVSIFNWPGAVWVRLEGCDGLKSIDLRGKALRIRKDDLLRLRQLQHCKLNNVDMDVNVVEELLLGCPRLQTLEMKINATKTQPLLVIKSDRILKLNIHIWLCGPKDPIELLVLDCCSLTDLELGGPSLKSLQIPQPLNRLHNVRLIPYKWGFVSSLLGAAPNIRNLTLRYNGECLSTEERVMEILNSLHCLETLKMEDPPEWFWCMEHPKFSTSCINSTPVLVRNQSNLARA